MLYNKENKKFLDKNKAILKLVRSSAWKYIKEEFITRINDYQSVMNVEGSTPEEVMLDVKLRREIAKELAKILADLEGTAAQFEANELSDPEEDSDYIQRYD